MTDDLSLRPAGADTARFAADLLTANYPDEPQDPATLASWWATLAGDATIHSEAAEIHAGPVRAGAASLHWHRPELDPERFGNLWADLLPEHRTGALFDRAHDAFEARLREAGVRKVVAHAYADDEFRLARLEARGFVRDRTGRRWELDLSERREAIEEIARRSRTRMEAEGIRVTTLDRVGDPTRWERLNRLVNEAEEDIPRTEPFVPESLETFMSWIGGPGRLPDRIWLAVERDDIVGISYLHYPPERGHVWTDFTGVARRARGRGVAMAVKIETLVQAIELGTPAVRTENDAQNSPILRINDRLGYRPLPASIELLKSF